MDAANSLSDILVALAKAAKSRGYDRGGFHVTTPGVIVYTLDEGRSATGGTLDEVLAKLESMPIRASREDRIAKARAALAEAEAS